MYVNVNVLFAVNMILNRQTQMIFKNFEWRINRLKIFMSMVFYLGHFSHSKWFQTFSEEQLQFQLKAVITKPTCVIFATKIENIIAKP